MPKTTRIAFALSDAIEEIKRIVADPEKIVCDIHLDAVTHATVVRELEYHFGAQLQRDSHYRGLGTAVKYQGMRLISILPGNRVT